VFEGNPHARKWVASDEDRVWSLESGDVPFQVPVNEKEVRG